MSYALIQRMLDRGLTDEAKQVSRMLAEREEQEPTNRAREFELNFLLGQIREGVSVEGDESTGSEEGEDKEYTSFGNAKPVMALADNRPAARRTVALPDPHDHERFVVVRVRCARSSASSWLSVDGVTGMSSTRRRSSLEISGSGPSGLARSPVNGKTGAMPPHDAAPHDDAPAPERQHAHGAVAGVAGQHEAGQPRHGVPPSLYPRSEGSSPLSRLTSLGGTLGETVPLQPRRRARLAP